MPHTCPFRQAESAIAAGHPPPVSALVNIGALHAAKEGWLHRSAVGLPVAVILWPNRAGWMAVAILAGAELFLLWKAAEDIVEYR